MHADWFNLNQFIMLGGGSLTKLSLCDTIFNLPIASFQDEFGLKISFLRYF